ncbi:MAG: tetratricopeptide repeat protein [Holosporales bacterium]
MLSAKYLPVAAVLGAAALGYALTGNPALPPTPYDAAASSVPLSVFTETERALSLDPENLELWLKLAAAESARNQPTRAAIAYRAALTLRPDEPRLQLRLASVLSQSGAFEEAGLLAKIVLAAENLAPQDYAEARQIKGSAAFAAGDYAGAAAAWRPLLLLPLRSDGWYRRFVEGWQQLPALYTAENKQLQ